LSRADAATRPPPRRRVGPVLGLFVLAPLVAEFLLGNLPVTWLFVLPVLALLYGGGALLIREAARRVRLSWPSIVLLGLAFGVVEEAFVTQSLFNPDYLGLRLLDYGYVAALGMGSWWTVFVLGLHTIWSISVPIAVVEALAAGPRHAPWLGRVGLGVTVALFIAGCLVTARFQPATAFHASAIQLAAGAGAVVAIVVAALGLGRRAARGDAAERARSLHTAPSPIAVGLTAFASGSGFMLVAAVFRAALPAAVCVAGMLVALVVPACAIASWSHRAGWSERHELAVAGGFLVTYAWYGFVQVPSVGQVSPRVDLLGNLLFSMGALAILAWAFVRVSRRDSPGV
jgi:hypothetical protein